MRTSSVSIPNLAVEWHQLDLRYQHLRMRSRQTQQRLMLSIHAYGLLVPIMVVPAPDSDRRWIVIDGYLRVSAVRALGQDTIQAAIWELETKEALIHAYRMNTVRAWGFLEEANLLYELMSIHHYSQAQLARCLGKSEAWVSQRLQLVLSLPECVKQAIYHGHLSLWSASRILIPFARANIKDAEKFINYLMTRSHSSREIEAFYQHYLQSNKKIRQQMIDSPQLFFKSLALSKSNLTNKQLMHYPPETIWESKLEQISDALDVLQSMIPAVFYAQQCHQEQTMLENRLQNVSDKLFILQQSIHRRTSNAPTSSHTDSASFTSNGQESPRNQQALKNITQQCT
jgi:ParB family transcriptional regulator, chromosome partitioning protein